MSTAEAAITYQISQRRVQQILKGYREAGEVPVLKTERRCEEAKPLSTEQHEVC